MNSPELVKEAEGGLGTLLDKLFALNPEFANITDLSQLSEDNFEMREFQRPAGYSATTRVHMGRLCVPVLNDSGASCGCITEEQVVILVNHTQHMLSEGLIKMTDYNYPLVQFYRYKHPAQLRGAEKVAKMTVEYAVVLGV